MTFSDITVNCQHISAEVFSNIARHAADGAAAEILSDVANTADRSTDFCCCAFADALRTELQQKLELELENIRKSHGAELRTARMELERAVEISKQKVCQLLPHHHHLSQSYLLDSVFTRILCAVTEVITETIFILLAA